MLSGKAVMIQAGDLHGENADIVAMVKEILSLGHGKVFFDGKEITIHPGFRLVFLLNVISKFICLPRIYRIVSKTD